MLTLKMLHGVLVMSPLTTFLLLVTFLVLLLLIVVLVQEKKQKRKLQLEKEQEGKPKLLEPPTPFKLPVIGHLHLVGGYEVPYQAFTDIGRKYGDVVKLQLGTVKCVVVNGQKNIREALVTRGHHFDSRPDFQRYRELFSGDKENSLAFCDWSETQRTRRDMLKAHTFPRSFTSNFFTLETLITKYATTLISKIETDKPFGVKPLVLETCANIFTNHFCSKGFEYGDESFKKLIENFDDIFNEVNQGYAADFLPFLMPLHRNNLRRINGLTHEIRSIILDKVIEDRYDNYNGEQPKDYVESLIQYVKNNKDFSWNTALFALEDILGGHSAVGNFLVKLFAFLANEPHVQKKIQKEIDEKIGTRDITIFDKSLTPYTEATVFEAVRLIASPIVPRVANQTSSIGEYLVEKGTVLFLNNYDLSVSDKLWDKPQEFIPERFIKENRLFKPEHFLPFGGGRRSCMGYKMVQLISFGLLGRLMQKFTIEADDKFKIPIGSLALPMDTFKFRFVRR